MLPWSVSARAFCPSLTHCATKSSMRLAPSRRLYSEWTCRWTKSGAVMATSARDGGRRKSFAPERRWRITRAGSPRQSGEQHRQQRLLRVQTILGLLVDEAARAVEHFVGHFEVAAHGHRVHQARVGALREQLLVDDPRSGARAAAG